MKMKSLTKTIKDIIEARNGKPFQIQDIIDQLEAEGIEVNRQSVQGMISRDLVRAGFVDKVGNRGPRGIYEGPAKGKRSRKKPLFIGLTKAARDIIKAEGGEFVVADIADKLTTAGVPFRLKHLQNVISNKLVGQGLVEKAGRKGRAMLYRLTEPAPPVPTEPEAPAPAVQEKEEPAPVRDVSNVSASIRGIIENYKGGEFIVDDVRDDLEDEGIEFTTASVDSCLWKLRTDGKIEVVGKRGRSRIYRQNPADVLPPDPPPNPPNFSAVFFAVAAGLQKFSMNYLTTMIAKVGPWTQAEAEAKAPSVVHRMKKNGHITATRTRPAVYEVLSHFYIDNLAQMPVYAETAPDLADRILQKFGQHCGPAPEPSPEPAPSPTAETVAPAPAATTTRSTAVEKIAEALNRIVGIAAQQTADEQVKEIRYSLEDKTQAFVNVTNKVRDLEHDKRKLSARVDRLEGIVEEKNRINAALQKRLNDALHGSRRPGSSGGTFALADLLHVEGGKIAEAAIDGSEPARDLPPSEKGAP